MQILATKADNPKAYNRRMRRDAKRGEKLSNERRARAQSQAHNRKGFSSRFYFTHYDLRQAHAENLIAWGL